MLRQPSVQTLGNSGHFTDQLQVASSRSASSRSASSRSSEFLHGQDLRFADTGWMTGNYTHLPLVK